MPIRASKDLVAAANAEVETISVADAKQLLNDDDAVFVDVRDGMELVQNGKIPGAVHASRGLLEFKADPDSPFYDQALSEDKRLVLYCGSGGRSALAAKTLKDMGYARVSHIGGGFGAWTGENGPTEEVR